MFLCAHKYVCTYLYLCVYVCVSVCTYMSACMCICVYICVCMCVHVGASVRVCMCVYVWAGMSCVCAYVWLPVCMHACMSVCVHLCVCVCVCLCVRGRVGKAASFGNLVLGLALALQGTLLRAPARAWRLSRALEAGSAPPSPFRAPPRLVKASHKLSTSLVLEGLRGRPPTVGTVADKHLWDTCRSPGAVLRALGPSHSITLRTQETSAGSHGR